MQKKTLDLVDQKMLEAVELLKQKGRIRFNQQFCDALEIPKQTLVNIKRGGQSFTVNQIKRACEQFGLNPNWLFGFSAETFRQHGEIRFISEGKKLPAGTKTGKK